MRVDPHRALAEEPCQLARVRCQDRRRAPLHRLEPEQRVCIDDRREVEPLQQRSHEWGDVSLASEPRPERDRIEFSHVSAANLGVSPDGKGEQEG